MFWNNQQLKPDEIKGTFQLNKSLSNKQIEYLYNSLLELGYISNNTTLNLFNDAFSIQISETKHPIHWLKSNKALAYLLLNLDLKSFITNSYQSGIEKYKLIKVGSKHKYIDSSSLSTAASESRKIPPKESKVLDEIIEKLNTIENPDS